MWRDEWHTWLLCRDTPDLATTPALLDTLAPERVVKRTERLALEHARHWAGIVAGSMDAGASPLVASAPRSRAPAAAAREAGSPAASQVASSRGRTM